MMALSVGRVQPGPEFLVAQIDCAVLMIHLAEVTGERFFARSFRAGANWIPIFRHTC